MFKLHLKVDLLLLLLLSQFGKDEEGHPGVAKRRRKRNSLATEGTAYIKPGSAEKPSLYVLVTCLSVQVWWDGRRDKGPGCSWLSTPQLC